MAKYLFKVFDKYTGDQKVQIIATAESMLETLEILNNLGMVKGFILDDNDKENEDDN